MKVSAALLLAAASAVVAERVSYDGFKVFRIDNPDDVENLHEKLEELNTVEMTCGHSDHLDVAVSPDALEAFELLGLDSELVSEDLAVELAKEGPVEEFFCE